MSEQKQVRGRKKTEQAKSEKVESKPTKAKKTEETPKTPEKTEDSKLELLCIIRVRGSVHVRQDIVDTMKMMNLHHINHATLVPSTPQYLGMIKKVQSYVTYGPIDRKTLSQLIMKRARVTGNKKLSDEFVQQNSDFKSIQEFEEAIFSGKATLRAIRGLKPVFRLHPPKGGHKGTIKKSRVEGGILGNVHGEINEFLKRMI